MSVSAQNTVVEKLVYSAQDNVPVEDVHVVSSVGAVYTNAKGEFRIDFNSFLEFSHVGFDNIIYNAVEEIPDTIWMNRNNIPLDDVTINAKREVLEIEKVSKYEIKNFEIINGHILVFKKSYRGSGTKLSLYDLKGAMLDEIDFDSDFEDIVTSCLGQVFLMDEASCFLIDVYEEEIALDSRTSRKEFEKLYEKCVLYNRGEWIYEYERFSGLERNIVSIIDGEDFLLKKIALEELVDMKKKDQWKIDLGYAVNTILTNDYGYNNYLHDLQQEGDYLDKILLTAHEENSFAVMDDGILIANAILDSLHYFNDEVVDLSFPINKYDFIFNNVEKSRTYLFHKNDKDQYYLSELDEEFNLQKVLSIDGDNIFRVRVYGDQVFYLKKVDSGKSIKIKLFFERI